MRPYYTVEVRLTKNKWTTVKVETRHVDALHYIKGNMVEHSKYPIRIVKVTRTIVFESK